jgi:hypothetical protein
MRSLRNAEEDETGTERGNQKPRTKSGRFRGTFRRWFMAAYVKRHGS